MVGAVAPEAFLFPGFQNDMASSTQMLGYPYQLPRYPITFDENIQLLISNHSYITFYDFR